VGQVREVAAKLQAACKARGVPCILVGHVTKDGSLAGPRVLEHLVDVVMQFEAAEQGGLRTLRALKNRFGSTQELGLFSMGEAGLAGVDNPSQLFLGGGGLALASLQGSRPLLAEVQALVSPAHFGQPQRQSSGLDPYRLSLLYAVMEKRCGLALYSQDVFVSVAGGLRITEPAADLAVALAVAQGLRNQPAPRGLACFGEVGLGGELRPVSRPADRLREAARLGFQSAIFPQPVREAEMAECRKAGQGLELKPAKDLAEALRAL
jgi:DNA repair protein RadA/Sms